MPVLTEKAVKGAPRIKDSKILVSEVFSLRTEGSCHTVRWKVIIVPLKESRLYCSCPASSSLKEPAEAPLPFPTGVDTNRTYRGAFRSRIRKAEGLTDFYVYFLNTGKRFRESLYNALPAKAKNASNKKGSLPTKCTASLTRFFHTPSR